MNKKLLLSFIFFAGIFYVQAQSHILLNNAILELPKNTSDYRVNLQEAYNGKIIRVIQFEKIPNIAQLETMASLGIMLLDYIPHIAYQAAIPVELTSVQLIDLGIQSVIVPTREFKLSPNLYRGFIPAHADRGQGFVELVILPCKNVPAEAVVQSLSLPYFEVLRIVRQGNFIEAVCHINDLDVLVQHPWISHIFEAEVPGEKENNTAISNHRINTVNGTEAPGYGFTGLGVKVSLGDDGKIGPHIDYKGRLDQSAANNSTGNHGDHVAGIIFGAGNRNPRGRGMAPGAEILYYSYPANLNNAGTDYLNQGIRITSSSYSNGCNAGYTNFTVTMDQTSREHEGLLHVFSAGNSGADDCGYGAGNGWGNITGGHKAAKNVLAVGNVTRFDVIASGSSRGPAHDGRIKPEVVAVGSSVYSTIDPHTYSIKSGTSMACPGVSGALAVLYEAYQHITSKEPVGALMKALLMNTADDLGNPGPDFIYGFGRINIRKTLISILDNMMLSDSITHNNTNTHTLYVPPGVNHLKVMLYWTDHEAFAGASKALVTDLDLSMQLGGNTYLPLILNPTPVASLLNAPAVPGIDTLNNVEQVVIHNPASGNYTINVNGTLVPFGTQTYYLVYYFENESLKLTYPQGGEKILPGTTEIIRWDAVTAGTFTLEYSPDSGLTWHNIHNSISANARHYSWAVPDIVNDRIKIRISRTGDSDKSDILTVIPQPDNLELFQVCLDSTTIQWLQVDTAIGYVVYKLGNNYMDSIAYTTATQYTINNVLAYDENWYSVAAVTPNGKTGRRALAIKAYEVYNCSFDYDLQLADIISPQVEMIPACVSDSLQLTVKIKNTGALPVTQFTFCHQNLGGTVICENVNLSINAGDSVIFTASNYLYLVADTMNHYSVWVNHPNDIHLQNDTLHSIIYPYGNQALSLPLISDFENLNVCATSSNCETTACDLDAFFFNGQNLLFDDIDWRVTKGETPSINTGPLADNTMGTDDGKYIYLEASLCFNKAAHLVSACFDLTNAYSPLLEFYHHRKGNSTGALHVEVFINNEWMPLINPITGVTGDNWVRYEADLIPYIGQKIAVRFIGHTSASWQGDIALDDISIKDFNVAPEIQLLAGDTSGCTGDTLIFYQNSTNAAVYAWDFGQGAMPATASGAGAHQVVYATPGLKTVSLLVSNPLGQDSAKFFVDVSEKPVAAFTYNIVDTDVSFTDLSSASPSMWNWDFGDGNSAQIQNPIHTYTSQGPHNVVLTAENDCGGTSSTTPIEILYFNINTVDNDNSILLYPNAGNGIINVTLQGNQQGKLVITNIDGQIIREIQIQQNSMLLDISTYSQGVYFLHFINEEKTVVFKYFLIR